LYMMKPSKIFSRRCFLQASAATLGAALVPGYAASSATNISSVDLGGLTLLQGAGCNVLAMAGEDGALLIDGGLAVNSSALLAVVKQVTGNSRIHTLINTHWHPEQTGLNAAAGQDGAKIIAHTKTLMYLSNTMSSETFEGRLAPLAEKARPTETTHSSGSLNFAGQAISYDYLPMAHTDGDLFVHFPGLNLVAAGGAVSAVQWPIIEYRNGGWLGGLVRAHEKLAELVVPDTRIVPALGPMLTGADIVRHRDMYQELYLDMIAGLNSGLGPEDVVERNPAAQYMDELGDPAKFLHGAYRSMQMAYVPDSLSL